MSPIEMVIDKALKDAGYIVTVDEKIECLQAWVNESCRYEIRIERVG